MEFKKEFNDIEIEKMINIFARWEKQYLTITHGQREKTTSYTYGLPYTSSGDFAGLWNTNVEAVLKTDLQWEFKGLVLGEDMEVVAIFTNNEESEHFETIGRIDK